jgi:phosphatidylglycerophosphate synthase
VTVAVLCSVADPDFDDAQLADELTGALLAAGATRVERIPPGTDPSEPLRDIARIARATRGPLLICAGDLVAHRSLLWMLATEPAGRSTALVVPDAGGDLREDRGRLIRATDGTLRFAGALTIATADLPILAAAAKRPSAAGPWPTRTRDTLDSLLNALFEAGLVPMATRVRLLHAERVSTAAEFTAARAAIAAVDEDAARLRLAVKDKDDFFTTYAVSTWSPLVTRWCARLGLTPGAVTGLSVLFAGTAALAFWQASRPAMVAGAVLLYLAFVLDCVDGQLARYTRRFDPYGGWLDTMADRAKEFLVYAGLAAGAERVGLPYAWPLAITALVLQTVRHMTDTWYGALHDEAATRPATGGGAGVGARLAAASTRVQSDTGSVGYWLKRVVVFPIGERWALIALVAALFDGRVALAAVVTWGLLAFAYTLGLRSLRAASMRVGVLDRAGTSRHRDDGPLVREIVGAARSRAPLAFALVAASSAGTLVIALLVGGLPRGSLDQPAGMLVIALLGGGIPGGGLDETAVPLVAVMVLVLVAGVSARARHGGPLDWLVPATLRAAEYLTVVAVALIGAVPPPVVYVLLFVLALHHYDLTARMEKGVPAGVASPARLGWDGRIVLLTGAALVSAATFGEAALAVLAGVDFLSGALADRRGGAPR